MKFKNGKKSGMVLKFKDAYGDKLKVDSPNADQSHLYVTINDGPEGISLPRDKAVKFAKAILAELGEA